MYNLKISLLTLLFGSLSIPGYDQTRHHDSYEWSRESPVDLKDACKMKPGSIFVLTGYNGGNEPSVDYGPRCKGKLDSQLRCDRLTIDIVDCKRVALIFVNATSQHSLTSSGDARSYGARAYNVFSRVAKEVVQPFRPVRFDSVVWGPSMYPHTIRTLFANVGEDAPILQSMTSNVNGFDQIDMDELPFIFYVDFTALLYAPDEAVKVAIEKWNSISITAEYSGWYMTFSRE